MSSLGFSMGKALLASTRPMHPHSDGSSCPGHCAGAAVTSQSLQHWKQTEASWPQMRGKTMAHSCLAPKQCPPKVSAAGKPDTPAQDIAHPKSPIADMEETQGGTLSCPPCAEQHHRYAADTEGAFGPSPSLGRGDSQQWILTALPYCS